MPVGDDVCESLGAYERLDVGIAAQLPPAGEALAGKLLGLGPLALLLPQQACEKVNAAERFGAPLGRGCLLYTSPSPRD